MLAGYAFQTPFDPFYHMAFVHGRIGDGTNVLTRLHRANLILDVFGGAKAIRGTLDRFKAEGSGVLVILRDGAAGVPVVGNPEVGRNRLGRGAQPAMAGGRSRCADPQGSRRHLDPAAELFESK